MRRILPLLLLSFAAGCAVSGGDFGGQASDLLELASEPLEPVGTDDWEAAPPSCEGRLSGRISFRLASVDGLVAAVEPDGDVVCVDTVESVQDELNGTGRTDEAQSLAASFLATVSPQQVGGLDEGDPNPQPNTQPFGFCAQFPGGMWCPRPGDPNPQPNMQ